MVLAPFLFKARALQALKGNWQTALLVSFFSGILTTVMSVLSAMLVPDPALYPAPEALMAALEAVPRSTWFLLGGLSLVGLAVNPTLQLGANHYFVSRLQGMELGFGGLLSRVKLWGKGLWLSILIGVKVFLWSLLLLVPGIIAGIRYSMAYYYLAEDPGLTAWEALEKSKNAMRNTKMSYFALAISFLGWALAAMLLPSWLASTSFVVAQVLSLCLNLFLNTYMNGAYAAFYLTVSDSRGLEKLHRSAAMMGRGPHSPFGVPMGFPGMSQEDQDQDQEGQDQREPEDQEPGAGPGDEPEADPGDQPGDEPSKDAAPPEDPGEA